MKPIYETSVTATGGRNGRVSSHDGVLQLDVRMPKELKGEGGAFTNPEQLFAAGYAACFDSALNLAARLERRKIESQVTATVGLKVAGLSGMDLTVTLDVKIMGVDAQTAQKLLDKAHKTCPYSKAIRNNVDVKINLVQYKKYKMEKMMKTKTLQNTIRATGLIQLILGIVFWITDADSLVIYHVLVGSLLTLALFLLVVKAFRLHLNTGLTIVALLWTLGLPFFGLIQDKLLPETNHWIIQVLHLLCALGAVGIAEMLAARIKKIE